MVRVARSCSWTDCEIVIVFWFMLRAPSERSRAEWKARSAADLISLIWTVTSFGRFQPYISMGPTFLIPILNQDRIVTNLNLQSSLGFAVQIGFDYMFNERWGVFFDLKKSYLWSKATGVLNGAPLAAKVKFDPLVLHTVVTYRF